MLSVAASTSSAAASAKTVDPKFVLTNGLVLAEFDIDKGACVRTYYPKASSLSAAGVRRKPIGVNVPAMAEYFANHMLPDGAEKLTVGRTIFIVNRPKPAVCSRFPVYSFTYGNEGRWVRPAVCVNAGVSEILMLDMKLATITVRFKDEVIVDGLPVGEGGVDTLPSMPPEVAEVASRLLAAPTTLSAPPTVAHHPSTSGEADAAALAAGVGTSAGTETNKVAFLVAKSENGSGRPVGFLLPASQRERFFVALAKALAPPTPPLEPLFATEVEAPHPVIAPGAAAAAAAATDATELGGEDKDAPATPPSVEEREKTAAEVGSSQAAHGLPVSDKGGEVHVDPSADQALEAAETLLLPTAPSHSQDFTAEAAVLADGPTPPAGEEASADSSPRQPTLPSIEVPAITKAPTSIGSVGTSSAVSSPTSRLSGVEENSGDILYGLCAVISKRDSTARRGGRTKAVALLGPSLAWLEPFFPILVEAAQYCCDIPGHDADALRQQSKVLKLCYEAINAAVPMVATGMAKTNRLSSEVAKYSTLNGAQAVYVTYHLAPFGTTHKACIPLEPSSHDIAFNRYGLEGLIEAMGPAFLHLVKGIMTEKKIIVLSRMGLSTDVAEATIALGSLGNLLAPTFVAEKVFPYTSINSAEHFMTIPGYIIGTLNPIFENEKAWHWDVLCDLDKQTVVLSEHESGVSGSAAGASPGSGGSGGGSGGTSKRAILSASVGGVVNSLAFGTGSHANGAASGAMAELEAASPLTAQFFKDLVSSIYSMRALRIPQSERNRRLRLTLEEFMQTAVMVTYTQGHPDVQTSQVALKDHFMSPALNSLRTQCRLTSMMDNVRANVLFPGESPLLLLYTATLRRVKGLDSARLTGLLNSVSHLLTTDEQVRLFLRRMTVAVGGLNPVGMQLTHPSQAVRTAAYNLLNRVDKLPEGKVAVAAMNGFLILVYENHTKRCPDV